MEKQVLLLYFSFALMSDALVETDLCQIQTLLQPFPPCFKLTVLPHIGIMCKRHPIIVTRLAIISA